VCGIAAVNGAKSVGLLLYRMQIVCGIAAVKGANCMCGCFCTGSKFVGQVPLYREQIGCGFDAVK